MGRFALKGGKYMLQKEILITYDRCMGCKSCEIACAVAHSESRSLFGAVLSDEKPLKRIFVNQAGNNKIPLNCRHCEDAPCIDACISGAMMRNKSGFVINENTDFECTGCFMCVMVCPYGIIRAFNRKAVKCDRECFGDTDEPACVRSCPTRAISYETVDGYSDKKRHDFLLKITDK